MGNVINIRKVEVDDVNTLAFIQTESWKNAFNNILSKEDLDKYTDINIAISIYTKLLNENIGNGFASLTSTFLILITFLIIFLTYI